MVFKIKKDKAKRKEIDISKLSEAGKRKYKGVYVLNPVIMGVKK